MKKLISLVVAVLLVVVGCTATTTPRPTTLGTIVSTTTTTKECHNLDYSGGLWSAAVSPNGERILFATSPSEDGALTITDVDLAYACKASLTPWDEENSRPLIASDGSTDVDPYCIELVYVGDLADGRSVHYCDLVD